MMPNKLVPPNIGIRFKKFVINFRNGISFFKDSLLELVLTKTIFFMDKLDIIGALKTS